MVMDTIILTLTQFYILWGCTTTSKVRKNYSTYLRRNEDPVKDLRWDFFPKIVNVALLVSYFPKHFITDVWRGDKLSLHLSYWHWHLFYVPVTRNLFAIYNQTFLKHQIEAEKIKKYLQFFSLLQMNQQLYR